LVSAVKSHPLMLYCTGSNRRNVIQDEFCEKANCLITQRTKQNKITTLQSKICEVFFYAENLV